MRKTAASEFLRNPRTSTQVERGIALAKAHTSRTFGVRVSTDFLNFDIQGTVPYSVLSVSQKDRFQPPVERTMFAQRVTNQSVNTQTDYFLRRDNVVSVRSPVALDSGRVSPAQLRRCTQLSGVWLGAHEVAHHIHGITNESAAEVYGLTVAELAAQEGDTDYSVAQAQAYTSSVTNMYTHVNLGISRAIQGDVPNPDEVLEIFDVEDQEHASRLGLEDWQNQGPYVNVAALPIYYPYAAQFQEMYRVMQASHRNLPLYVSRVIELQQSKSKQAFFDKLEEFGGL